MVPPPDGLLEEIFSFLPWQEALNARAVCSRWKLAALRTPVVEIFVCKRAIGLDLAQISKALPRTQAIKFDFGSSASEEFDIKDGEGAQSRLSHAIEGERLPPPVDLAPLTNIIGLRHLCLKQTGLRGAYPFLFQFRNLQTLNLLWNPSLDWDLSMLAGLTQLKELYCPQNHALNGNLTDLGPLSHTLVKLNLFHCFEVTGSLSDVAHFPLLEELDVGGTKVHGDIREMVGPNLFISIKALGIGDAVYGGGQLRAIEDAPSIMYAHYQLLKRIPDLFKQKRWRLQDDSPQRYQIRGHHSRAPPFWVEFVEAGPRMGWRWTNCVYGGSCETHWLDPEPGPSDDDYNEYCKSVKDHARDVSFYRGFLKPPTQEEHAQRSRDDPLDSMTARFSSRSCFGVW